MLGNKAFVLVRGLPHKAENICISSNDRRVSARDILEVLTVTA